MMGNHIREKQVIEILETVNVYTRFSRTNRNQTNGLYLRSQSRVTSQCLNPEGHPGCVPQDLSTRFLPSTVLPTTSMGRGAGRAGTEGHGPRANVPPAPVSSRARHRARLPPPAHKLPRNKSLVRPTDPLPRSGRQTFSQGTSGHN